MNKKLPENFYVHVKIHYAGRPLVCDFCNAELWYPGKYTSSSFYCEVVNFNEIIEIPNLVCEKCMKNFEKYDDTIILEKSEIPPRIIYEINKAIVDCIVSVLDFGEKVRVSFFDPNIMKVDSIEEDRITAGITLNLLKNISRNKGIVVEAI